MSKKVITLLCVIALLVTAVCVYAAADAASAVAAIGTQNFATWEAAVDAVNEANPELTIITLKKDLAEIEVTQTVYLDLAGKSIASVKVEKDVTLYCLDSETDDYVIEGDEETGYTGFGRIAAVTGEGKVAGVEAGMIPVAATEEYVNGSLDSYLMVEDAGLSFHRVNLQIKAMTLRAKEEGAKEVNPSVYYRSAFGGDVLVAKQVKTFGIALSVQEEPNADNMGITNEFSWFDGENFVAGENNNDATSTLLKGILKESNAKLTNRSNANMPVLGRAYIQLEGGQYIFGVTASRTLRDQTEGVAALWDRLVDEKKKPVMEMYDVYRSVMQNWNVARIADEPRKDVRILGIGNSYTVDSMRMLAEVYKAEGSDKNVTLGIAYHGGCLLSEHYDFINENAPEYVYYYIDESGKWVTEKNVTLRYILEKDNWDLVSMQQGSAHSGLVSTYKDEYINCIQGFVERILGYTPTYMWNMTWAWPVEDCDDDGDTALESNSSYKNYYSSNQETMYEMIVDCVQQKIVTNPKFEYLMPVGTAIQNARSSFLTDKDLHRDDSHVNDLGRLIAAHVWYCEIEGVTLDEIQLRVVPERLTYSYEGGNMTISDSVAEVAAESVKNAMANKFSATQSEYTNDYSTRKILAIGNSYSVDSMRMLKEIYDAEGSGKNPVLGIAYNAGCSLDEHVGYIEANSTSYTYYYMANGVWKTKSKVTLEYILQQEEWEYVSLQQASGYSGMVDSYSDEHIATIMDCVETNLGYRPVYMWNMTWAYPEVYLNSSGEAVTNTTNAFVQNYGSSQETMYSMIVDCVQQKIVTNPVFEYLMPVGTAIQNAHTSFLGDEDLYRDNLHLNDLGRVFAGYVWYCTLENETLDGIELTAVPKRLTNSYEGGDMLISESIAKVIAESVKNAMSNKFEVTQSQYPENVLD